MRDLKLALRSTGSAQPVSCTKVYCLVGGWGRLVVLPRRCERNPRPQVSVTSAGRFGWGNQECPETLLLITLSLMAPPVQRAVSDKLYITSDSVSSPPPIWTLCLLGDNDNVCCIFGMGSHRVLVLLCYFHSSSEEDFAEWKEPLFLNSSRFGNENKIQRMHKLYGAFFPAWPFLTSARFDVNKGGHSSSFTIRSFILWTTKATANKRLRMLGLAQ